MGVATTTTDTTLAACTLYNILRQKHGANSIPSRIVDSEDVNYEVMYRKWRHDPHRMAAQRLCRTHNAPAATKGMGTILRSTFAPPSIREVDRMVRELK